MRPTSVFCVLLACAALSASHAQVSVTGTGNVGVGSMSVGTINIVGLTTEQLKAALKADRAERVRLERKLAGELNAATAKPSPQSSTKPPVDEFNATIVNGFLATVVGKKVPEGDWPRVFNELANRFLETGNRIAATPVTSDAIKALVASADAARKAGDFDKADTQLELAEREAIKDAADRKEQWRESNRQAASLLASRGSLALSRLERRKGAELLQRAFEQRRDDVNAEAFWWLIEASDAWMQIGDNESARRVLERSRDTALAQTAYDTGPNPDRGYRAQDQSDFVAQLKNYQARMGFSQKLMSVDPDNSEHRRNLSVSHVRIGDIEQAQGHLAAALKSYQGGMEMAQKLAATDLDNSEWQLDLAVNHERIGDIEQAQGNFAAALKSFRAGMDIRQKLAATDLGNSQWKFDFVVSSWSIGNLKGGLLGSAERRAVFVQGLKVLDELEKQGRLAPSVAAWPTMFRTAITNLK